MRWNNRFYKKNQIGIDAISLLISLFAAIYIKHQSFIFPKSFTDLLFTTLIVGFWFLAAHQCKLYRNRIYKKFPEELLFNFYASFLFVIFLSAFLFLTKSDYANLFSFSVFVGIHFSLSTSFKYYIRKKQHSAFYEGALYDSIIIVGYNKSSIEFYKTLKEHVYYGYKCVGFINEAPITHDIINSDDVHNTSDINYLGTLNDLYQQLTTQHVDEVIIALPSKDAESIRYCVDICDQLNIRVRIMPALFDLTTKAEEMDNLGVLSVINLNELPLDKWENKIFKNIFDKIFASLFFIIIGWWLFPIIALIIKLDSKGPVFYKQERWGVNNTPIICYKFRTMQFAIGYKGNNNEDFEQTSRNDPRVTKLGKVLRKYSLDELPQFWNVLNGEMSVVGPRPHPTPMNLESMNSVANYLKRHMVKPGITGWAQINGCRGEVRTHEEMEQRVNFDLYYIHRWSFTLDMQIILQTIIKMLRDKGAY
jgi:putative colanic acid biosynthesis UDP-glucose lipid carrier transferase